MAGTAGANAIGAEMADAMTGSAGIGRCREGLAGTAAKEGRHRVLRCGAKKNNFKVKTLARVFIHPGGGRAGRLTWLDGCPAGW